MVFREDLYLNPQFVEELLDRLSTFKVEQMIPGLIEIGFNIINPIQPECMDPVKIKKMYGDRITLHGTISAQKTLPFGTPEEVRKEVLSRIKECGYNGGLILAPANALTTDVPIENVLTLYNTTKETKLS